MKTARVLAALALSCTCLAGTAAAAPTVVEPGHSAVWYDPARSGEGWVLEILNDDRAAAYWFTYDEQGRQRWLVGAGNVVTGEDGRRIEFPELMVASGGRFGADFEPDDVTMEVAGSATFRFDDCSRGTVSYDAFGEAGETPIRRLTRTMGAGCSPINGVPGFPIQPYAGQSGAWYDVTHTGEGFTVQWMSRDQAIAYWYSYDDQGNQVWMFGIGREHDGQIEFPELLSTRGARFGGAFDPADVELFEWGGMAMELACNDGTMSYESPLPAFGSGGQELQRLNRLRSPGCPYVQPMLTDLYDIKVIELPIAPVGPIEVKSIANDGTVVGVREVADEEAQVHLWRPGAAHWGQLSGQAVWSTGPLLISGDAARIVANEVPDPTTGVSLEPVEWMLDAGWQPIPGINTAFSEVRGGSTRLSALVGRMRLGADDDRVPWIWDPAGGQRQLQSLDDLMNESPVAVSDDASVVVGTRVSPTTTPVPPARVVTDLMAVRWTDGEPAFMADPDDNTLSDVVACSADCNVVIGSGRAVLKDGTGSARNNQAWVWTADGHFGFLELFVEDDPLLSEGQTPVDVSADGSMVIGTVQAGGPLVDPPPPNVPFVWTQRTGNTRVLDLLPDGTAEALFAYNARAVALSPAGNMILLKGNSSQQELGPNTPKAVILELVPKSE